MSEDRRLELRVSGEWLARLDAARGVLPRGTFVKRALEQALGPQQGGKGREAEEPDVVKRAASASARTSVVETRAALERGLRASPSPSLSRFMSEE